MVNYHVERYSDCAYYCKACGKELFEDGKKCDCGSSEFVVRINNYL